MNTRLQCGWWMVTLAGFAAPGCQLDRRTELLEDQYLIARMDNSLASQSHLDEEYRRELLHVRQLSEEVAELMAQEEVLAEEAGETNIRLAELEDEKKAAEAAAVAEKARVAELLGEVEATRTPTERAPLAARIAALEEELDRLGVALAAMPAEAAKEEPAPAEAAKEEAAPAEAAKEEAAPDGPAGPADQAKGDPAESEPPPGDG